MSRGCAVIIPALDEEANIGGVLADLRDHCSRVVVVDNGSTDQTAAVAAAAGAVVVSEPRRGYGNAILAGMAHLTSDPPDVVVILDADGADDVARLGDLVAPIVEGRADLVLSDRTRFAEPGALTTTQVFGNELATRLMHLAVGHPYRDLGPFRAVRWTSLVALQMRDPTWGWNVEMQMKAVRHGLRVAEVPVRYMPRRSGKSKISGTLRGSARAGVRILQAVARYRR